MSQVSSNHSQDSGNIPAPSSERPDKLSLPGWPAVVVHVVFNLPTVPALVLAGMG